MWSIKTAKKLVRILNKNEHLRASLDTSNFVISIRSEQELDRKNSYKQLSKLDVP